MPYRRPDKLRQVAVLVASLDPAIADSLLDGLSPADAQQVRKLAAELDDIDPEEQADILDQLRRGVPAPDVDYQDTVEIETSLAEQIDRMASASPPRQIDQPESLHERLARADALAIARRLTRESPQTIAVILLRLSQEQAAAVFDDLPLDLQPAVLDRLATSIPADEETVIALETQIAQWIDQDQRAQSHQAAGSELARLLKTRTPSAAEAKPQKQQPIARRNPPWPNHRYPTIPWSPEVGLDADAPPLAITAGEETTRELPTFRIPCAAHPAPPPAPAAESEAPRYDPAELDQLDDRTLWKLLSEIDTRSAQLVLHAGSNRLVKRVLRRMPRSAARQLRQQLRNLGPVQISEVDQAQQELLRLARGHQE